LLARGYGKAARRPCDGEIMVDKDYIAVVQCEIVKERCSGYSCEKAFHDRTGGFADYAGDRSYRIIYLTCGGCCGKAVQRKLTHLARMMKKSEGVDRDRIVVQLGSCITKDNYHSPRCMFADYMKELIARAGFECREDTHVSATAEGRRAGRAYKPRRTRP
jgi:predicted metal-binding protein